MMRLPPAFSAPYLHFTLFTLVIFLFILRYAIVRFAAMMRQLRRKWNPPAPFDPHLLTYLRNAFLFWVILLIPAAVLLSFAFFLTKYQYIGLHTEPVGIAQLKKGVVHFTGNNMVECSYQIKGSRAAAAGVVMNFPRWTRFIGLGSYHQLIGFHGNQDNELRYFKPKPDALEPYVDGFFLFLYKHQKWSVIKTQYLESPYFGAGEKHRILITPNGYIVE
jgi:hypothetical protein